MLDSMCECECVCARARPRVKKKNLTRLRAHFACNLLDWLVLNFCQIKENRGRGNCVRMEVMSFLLTRAEPEMKGSYGGAAVASMGGCKQETLRHTTSISNADTFVIPYQLPQPSSTHRFLPSAHRFQYGPP